MIELQLGSLATIFSALAAILVVAQLSINSPLIFTTIFQNLRNKELVLVVKANAENNLTFYIHNVSKSTAIDVVVRVEFPQQIRVLSIDTPVWSTILNNGRGFEIHLDTDRCYNPVHPFTVSSLNVKIRVNELPGPQIMLVHTLARNMLKLQ